MPFSWEETSEAFEEAFSEYDFENSTDTAELRMGAPAPEDFGIGRIFFDVRLKKLGPYDILPMTGGPLLLGRRLKEFMSQSAGNDLEFLPAKVIAKDGESSDYFLMNVLNKIPCVDKEKSKREPKLTMIYSVVPGGLVLVDDCMQGHQIVRDASLHSLILVSDELAEKLRQADFKGLELKAPEDY